MFRTRVLRGPRYGSEVLIILSQEETGVMTGPTTGAEGSLVVVSTSKRVTQLIKERGRRVDLRVEPLYSLGGTLGLRIVSRTPRISDN